MYYIPIRLAKPLAVSFCTGPRVPYVQVCATIPIFAGNSLLHLLLVTMETRGGGRDR